MSPAFLIGFLAVLGWGLFVQHVVINHDLRNFGADATCGTSYCDCAVSAQGQVQANMARALELCRGIAPRSVDLVCFPEMAFSGYTFESSSAILPFLEASRTGPTSAFCVELARRLGCYVFAGFPEKLSATEAAKTALGEHAVGANSAVLVDPAGNWLGGYRKTNLYTTDMTWAEPGTGFTTFPLPPPLNKVSLGICMDLNPVLPVPDDWTRSDGPYELAQYAVDQRADILVLLNAWLDSSTYTDQKHDLSTLDYWAERLRPLWQQQTPSRAYMSGTSKSEGAELNGVSDSVQQGRNHESLVVVCNRGGTENGKKYAGCSAVFRMRRGEGKKGILRAVLGREDEDVLIWDGSVDGSASEGEDEEGSGKESS